MKVSNADGLKNALRILEMGAENAGLSATECHKVFVALSAAPELADTIRNLIFHFNNKNESLRLAALERAEAVLKKTEGR